MMNNREKGSCYETQAASFFESQGYEILARNYKRRTGEIDLIAKDGDTYVFCEVKYRANLKKGYPMAAVTPQKQQHIYRTAEYYMAEKGLPSSVKCRFDVVSILGSELTHIKNAFGGF